MKSQVRSHCIVRSCWTHVICLAVVFTLYRCSVATTRQYTNNRPVKRNTGNMISG